MAEQRRTAAEVAKWMFDQITCAGDLDQSGAAIVIRKEFGPEFIYTTAKGNPGIVKSVLDEFRKLHKGRARYYPKGGRWILE